MLRNRPNPFKCPLYRFSRAFECYKWSGFWWLWIFVKFRVLRVFACDVRPLLIKKFPGPNSLTPFQKKKNPLRKLLSRVLRSGILLKVKTGFYLTQNLIKKVVSYLVRRKIFAWTTTGYNTWNQKCWRGLNSTNWLCLAFPSREAIYEVEIYTLFCKNQWILVKPRLFSFFPAFQA